jgi:ABC-type uncharacterized transport system ATPase subunit
MIKVSDVKKYFGDVKAVDGVSFTAPVPARAAGQASAWPS